jgi:hypothetical protein
MVKAALRSLTASPRKRRGANARIASITSEGFAPGLEGESHYTHKVIVTGIVNLLGK